MPIVGFITVLDTIGLGVGTLGLEDTVRVSVLAGSGSCVLLTLSEEKYWIEIFVGTPQM